MKNKLINWVFTLIIVGTICLMSNWIGYEVMPLEALPGILLLMGIVILGFVIHDLLPFQVPGIAYIGILGFILTVPGVPGSDFIVEWTSKVNLLALTTPVLAYAGISIGETWIDFAKLGWKTLVVGVVVLLGTYLGSAIVAEIILRFQGIV